MRVESRAKINWMLRVLGRREDRYHEIETVFQEISLFDLLEIEEATELAIECNDPGVPVDGRNLVAQAWQIAHDLWDCPPVSITIDKRIPPMGGLGGGSSNAATLLKAVNWLFDLGRSDAELETAAGRVGSDAAFFVRGGTQYATGRGEKLTPIGASIGGAMLLVTPEGGVSTAEAYEALGLTAGEMEQPLGRERAEEILTENDRPSPLLTNDFEPVIFSRHPLINSIHRRLSETGAEWVRLCGSGSTVVAWYATEEARDAAREPLEKLHRVATACPVHPLD